MKCFDGPVQEEELFFLYHVRTTESLKDGTIKEREKTVFINPLYKGKITLQVI